MIILGNTQWHTTHNRVCLFVSEACVLCHQRQAIIFILTMFQHWRVVNLYPRASSSCFPIHQCLSSDVALLYHTRQQSLAERISDGISSKWVFVNEPELPGSTCLLPRNSSSLTQTLPEHCTSQLDLHTGMSYICAAQFPTPHISIILKFGLVVAQIPMYEKNGNV